MPQVVGLAVLAAVGQGGLASMSILGGLTTLGTVVGQVAITAASIGVSYAISSAMRPATPKTKRQRIDLTTEQKVAPRQRCYGLVRSGGHKVFEAPAFNYVNRVIAFNHGEIEAFDRIYFDERRIHFIAESAGGITTWTEDHFVTPVHRYRPGQVDRIWYWQRLGSPNQNAYGDLLAFYPGDLDSRFRQRETATLYFVFRKVNVEDYLRTYPSGLPAVSAAFRATKVYDTRAGGQSATDKSTWAYSDNPALCYLDALRCPELCLRTTDFTHAPIADFDTVSFSQAANDCDATIATKAGGTEKKYTFAGIFDAEMRPADIERRLLLAMDGFTWIDDQGRVAVLAGKWIAPTVTLGENAVTGIWFEVGANEEEAFNYVTPTILWPDNQFQETECPAWKDAVDIAARGAEYKTIIDYPTNSWRQAQRLAKRAGKRFLAPRRGTITTNLRGEMAAGQRFITLNLPSIFGDSIQVEITRFWRISGQNPGCRIEWIQTASTDWDWDAATEEGDAPIVDNPGEDVRDGIDPPSGPSASDGGSGMISVSWSNPTWGGNPDNRNIEIEWRKKTVGNPNPWVRTTFNDRTSPKQVGPVTGGNGDYEVRARYWTYPWVVSDWKPQGLALVTMTSAYEVETEALVARFNTAPTTARKNAINTLIQSLKTNGVWDRLDALWVLAAADSQAARLNWKGTSYTLTANGSPTFTADRGYTGNGTNAYLDTGLNPATFGGMYVLNDAHLGVWNLTNISEAASDFGNATTHIIARSASNNFTARINSGAASIANSIGSGHYLVSRSASTGFDRYKNGAALTAATQASTSVDSRNFWILGRNAATPEYSTDQIFAAHLGKSLTSAQVTALYNALDTYRIAVGA